MMKTLRAVLVGLLTAGIVYTAAPVAQVQAADAYEWLAARILSGEASSRGVSAVSTHTSLLIQYFGTSASPSGLLAVAAGGDMTFTQGVASSEAATAEFECPVSGALGGVIDVSDTACDTLGEVCDVINGATGGGTAQTSWKCVILDGLAADSSNDTLVTFSAAQASGGLALLGDTAVTFDVATALLPPNMRLMDWYVDGTPKRLKKNPFDGLRTHVVKVAETTTFGSGTSTIQITSAKDETATTSTGQKLTETATTLWSQAGGDTTVEKILDFSPLGLQGYNDTKVVVKVNNSAANTASVLYAQGYTFPWRR